MKSFFFFLLTILTVSFTSCQKEKGYVQNEINGLVSIEAEHYFKSDGWRVWAYYTGIAVHPAKSDSLANSYLLYKVSFSSPGNYKLYLLGNQIARNFADTSQSLAMIQCDLLSKKNQLLQSFSFILPKSNAPIWSGFKSSDPVFNIEKSGDYFIKILPQNTSQFSLDKFIVSSLPDIHISGTGTDETLSSSSSLSDPVRIILPPAWAFGVLYGGYTDQDQSRAVVDSLIAGDYPIDAYWIDSYFWDFNGGKGPGGYVNFVGDTTAFYDVKKLWSYFGEQKIKSGIWIWNLINKQGNESVYNYFHQQGYFSREYENKNGWHNESKDTQTGVIDFASPEAEDYWKQQLKPFFDKGLDFLKLDNSSNIPFCRAAFTASQELGKETKGRGFILAHLSETYDDRFKLYPTRWSGDAKICWNQPDYPNMSIYAMGGYKENIAMVANPKLSTYEIPFLTHDAGGYDYFGSTEQSDELYIRWIQFSSMNSIMTIFSTAKNPTRNHPYRYSVTAQENFRKYTHLRNQLFPYLYSSAFESTITNKKMVRGDGIHSYQYMLGNELLVAPVFEKGSVIREVFLPEGKWFDYETEQLYEGGKNISADAPLTKLPMFVKAGAIIPMRKYARAIELGTNDTLMIHIYPSEQNSEYVLYEDDGTSNDYLTNKFSSTKFRLFSEGQTTRFSVDPVNGTFTNMPDKRLYQFSFHQVSRPDRIMVDGSPINESKDILSDKPFWQYNSDKKQLLVVCQCFRSKGCVVRFD